MTIYGIMKRLHSAVSGVSDEHMEREVRIMLVASVSKWF